MPPETRAELLISDDVRACRIGAIDYSRGTSLLAGVSLSQVIEELNRRYIDGQISNGKLSAAIRKIYRLH